MDRGTLELAIAAGKNLSRRLDSLRAALENGEEQQALDLAREITGLKPAENHGQASCR